MDITLNIDDEIVKKVHKIAADKNTTLAIMVSDYLTLLANSDTPALDAAARKGAAASFANRGATGREQTTVEEAIDKLEETWDELSRPMGPRNWTRDDLYDRFDHRYSR